MSLLIAKRDRHEGCIGVVSRSGSLCPEAAAQLVECGFGPAHIVGIGAEGRGTTPQANALRQLNDDPGTEAVVIVGDGDRDIDAICPEWVAREMNKPVLGFVEHPVDVGIVPRRAGGIPVVHSAAELSEHLQSLLGTRFLPFD